MNVTIISLIIKVWHSAYWNLWHIPSVCTQRDALYWQAHLHALTTYPYDCYMYVHLSTLIPTVWCSYLYPKWKSGHSSSSEVPKGDITYTYAYTALW